MSTDSLALDSCLKCSVCVTYCPVARVTNKYTGPKQHGPDLERFRIENKQAIDPSVAYCSNCKSCDVACPSGVNVSTMITRAKGELVVQQGAPLRDKLLSNVELLGKICGLAPGFVNKAGQNKALRTVTEGLFGVSRDMPFPRYAPKTFHRMHKGNKPVGSTRKVVYYPGCYVTYNTPEVGLAVVEVLEKNGVEVVIDKFACCGLPMVANGLLRKAKLNAEQNVQKLQAYLDQGLQIITSCPSCNLTLRHEFHELFALDPKGSLRDGVMDVFEYLQMLAEQGELNTEFKQVPLRVGYHQPCHLRAGGFEVPSAPILKLIPGLEVNDLDAGCCGGSGTYSFKQEKYDISQKIGAEITHAVRELKVNQVLTDCGMCQLQIEHVSGARVSHPIQLVSQAYKNAVDDN